MQQDDVVGHDERAALLVPAGAVAGEHGYGAFCDLRADFRQVQVHHLGVGGRRDHRGCDVALRAEARTVPAA